MRSNSLQRKKRPKYFPLRHKANLQLQDVFFQNAQRTSKMETIMKSMDDSGWSGQQSWIDSWCGCVRQNEPRHSSVPSVEARDHLWTIRSKQQGAVYYVKLSHGKRPKKAAHWRRHSGPVCVKKAVRQLCFMSVVSSVLSVHRGCHMLLWFVMVMPSSHCLLFGSEI
jgi:hypothetical protein